MADELERLFTSVEAGQKAADRLGFGVIQGITPSDFVGSDMHNASSALDVRRDAFILGIHLWGSDDQKVI